MEQFKWYNARILTYLQMVHILVLLQNGTMQKPPVIPIPFHVLKKVKSQQHPVFPGGLPSKY